MKMNVNAQDGALKNPVSEKPASGGLENRHEQGLVHKVRAVGEISTTSMEAFLTAYEAIEAGTSRVSAHESCRPSWRSTALALAGVLIVTQGILLWRAQSASEHSLALLESLERAHAATMLQTLDRLGGHGLLQQDNPATVLVNRKQPHKFLLSGITPSVDQMYRGDCWLFSLTGIVEDSYRRYGVKRGWLEPDSYVQLSRQAMGIAVMDFCHRTPSFMCPAESDSEGNIWWGNTTEGADERMLFFFEALGQYGALPASVCPYSKNKLNEKQCESLDEKRRTNPLQFNVTRADSFYESLDIKDALLEKQQPLTLGITMAWNKVDLPCTNWTAKYYPGCVQKVERALCSACKCSPRRLLSPQVCPECRMGYLPAVSTHARVPERQMLCL
jgi:hypothetical protein